MEDIIRAQYCGISRILFVCILGRELREGTVRSQLKIYTLQMHFIEQLP